MQTLEHAQTRSLAEVQRWFQPVHAGALALHTTVERANGRKAGGWETPVQLGRRLVREQVQSMLVPNQELPPAPPPIPLTEAQRFVPVQASTANLAQRQN